MQSLAAYHRVAPKHSDKTRSHSWAPGVDDDGGSSARHQQRYNYYYYYFDDNTCRSSPKWRCQICTRLFGPREETSRQY